MPTLTVDAVDGDGVTFVEVVVEADRPHRVRIESRADGPVWPPRRNGEPVAGWDERGVTTTVRAGRTALGFATPGSPDDRPVALVDAEPIDDRPDGLQAWLDRVERRVDRAESLADVGSLEDACEAMASVGGLAAAEALAADLTRDRRVLSRLAIETGDLERRLASVDVPTAAFAALAARLPPEPPIEG